MGLARRAPNLRSVHSPLENSEEVARIEEQDVVASPLVGASGGPSVRGRYHVLRLLGHGGMGAVYEVYDLTLARRVALKVLRAKPEHGESTPRHEILSTRLVQEAKALAKLSHSNVVAVFDAGRLDDGSAYMAMELIAGRSLAAALADASFTWRQALDAVLLAGDGLAAAHAAGLLHLDFKPENIMLGEDGLVRVIDFGLSRDSGTWEAESRGEPNSAWLSTELVEANLNSAFTGTFSYMAPELFLFGGDDVHTDLFAFACVLYEVVAGGRAFPAASPLGRLHAIRRRNLQWSGTEPPWLRDLIAQGLSWRPSERGSSVASLVAAIRAGLAREQRKSQLRRRLIALATSFIGIPLVWSLLADRPARPPDIDCTDPELRSGAVLDPLRRSQAQEGFLHTGLANAQNMWEETSIRLDSWKATWNQQASLLCPEVRNGKALPPFEPEVREQSRACLHESLTQIGTLLDLWTRASARQVLDASTALLTIVDPVRCLDAQYLRKRTPLPLDPLERRAITEIDAEIAGARVLSDQEDSEEAQRKIDRIALGIAKFGHLPSWARLGAVVSHLSTRTRSIFELAPHHRAILLGIASNQTHLAADATEYLWFLQVYAAGHLEMSEEILGYHLALVQRAGYPLELEDGLERNRWIRRLIDGDFAASMPHVLRTAAINYEKYGEVSIPYARSLYDVGLSEGRLFDYRAALNDYQKSLDILAAILPKGHPIRARSALGVAMALGKLNRVDESREILLEAWRECSEAGLAAIACAEFSRVLADEELRTGNLQAALEISAMVDGIERAENRRIDVTEPWTQERVGYILACRGEGEAGVAWAKAGYERLRSEPSVHPSANLRGVLDLGRTCFAAHDLSCARANLDAAEQIFAAQNGEFSVHERSSLMALRGRVLTAEHRYTPALVALEEALAVAEDNREPAIDRVSHHLDLAKAWHGLGDLAMALHHANLALELEHASRGVLGHRAWPVHALLAELWHASGEMNEALHHIEMVEKIFDRRQEDRYPRERFGRLKAKLRQLAR